MVNSNKVIIEKLIKRCWFYLYSSNSSTGDRLKKIIDQEFTEMCVVLLILLLIIKMQIMLGYYQQQQPMYVNQPPPQQQQSGGGMGICMTW